MVSIRPFVRLLAICATVTICVGQPGAVAVAAEPATTAAAAASGSPQQVVVGTYLQNVESINIADNTYLLSFYLWMKWRGDIDPTASFDFVNLVNRWGITTTPVFETPVTLADGFSYQRYLVEGNFYHKFWLGAFPLDWQKVLFEIEDKTYSTDELVYVPDLEHSRVEADLAIPGWNIVRTYNQADGFRYASNFGGEREEAERVAPRYRYGIKIERPVAFYLFKVLPPMMLSILCCLMVFYLAPQHVDSRISTTITVLLTEVFLQLTMTSGLPSLGMMLLIDHLYNCSYVVVVLCLVICVFSTRAMDRAEALREAADAAEGAEAEALRARADAIFAGIETRERRVRHWLPLAYLVAVACITLAVRGGYFFEMLGRS